MHAPHTSSTLNTSSTPNTKTVWPVVVDDPHAPALLDEDGQITTWLMLWQEVQARAQVLSQEQAREQAQEQTAKTSNLLFLHEGTSKRLIVEIWAAQMAGYVPVLLHPRLPATSARSIFARVERDWLALPAIPDDVADILLTSGSTGQPKAVVHTAQNHQASAQGAAARLPFGVGQRWLLSLPLCHVGGLALLERARLGGGCLALPRAGERLPEALRRTQSTHVSVVAAQLRELLQADSQTDSSTHHPTNFHMEHPQTLQTLQAIIVGGGPTPVGLLHEAARRGWPILQTWGLTETTAMVSLSEVSRGTTRNPSHDENAPPPYLLCGTPLPLREVKCTDTGLLAIRGPTVCLGYLTDCGIVSHIDHDGYWVTADRGYIHPDGSIEIQGRMDAMFISGGENIHPEQIEDAILSLPNVTQVVVVPVPDTRWGMRPVAFVDMDRRRENQHVTDVTAHIRTSLADKLPNFLLPDRVFPWPDDVPAGKILRPWFIERARSM